jgi:hypothetical protein
MYSGCVLDTLSWQMQRSGLLTATASLVAQGESIAASPAAGTLAELALQRFGHFNGSITRNGTPLGNIVSAEITYANNLDRIETIRADGRIDGADPSIAALTGRIEVRFADQVLVNQAIDGDPCEMGFAYVLPSGESLTLHRACRLPAAPADRDPRAAGRAGHLRLAGRARQHRWAGCARHAGERSGGMTDAHALNLTREPRWHRPRPPASGCSCAR